MKHLQILTAKSLCIIALFSLSLYAFALDQDVQVDILTTKITTALKADKHADALPYFMQLEEMESSLKKALPESFHFQYIKTLSLTGDKDKALNKSEAYLSKYGKKGKYYSQVLEIISPLQIERDKESLARQQSDGLKQAKIKELQNLISSVSQNMVELPTGSFMMGNKTHHPGYTFASGPAHPVAVDYVFSISKYKVTQGQWRAIMGKHEYYDDKCGPDCPVVGISWFEAQTYIQKLNAISKESYRLLTEAEWEYACRAGTGYQYRYCGGNKLDEDVKAGKSKPVGQLLPNAWGIYDMASNDSTVEWVQDEYHEDYVGAPNNAKYPWNDGDNRQRVVRGGYSVFDVDGSWDHAAHRAGGYAVNKSCTFRLAKTIK